MKVSYDTAVAQMDEQLAQLKNEKQKNLELLEQLQLSDLSKVRAKQVNGRMIRAGVAWRRAANPGGLAGCLT